MVVQLTDISNWSDANAAQVVGMQWQWTSPTPDLDAGAVDASAGCTIDVTITGIKFLP